MSRYNRLSSNFSFVFLVLIIVLCASWLWQTETRSTQLDYSQVRQLFIQEKVERFTIDSNYNLTMTLREARDDSVKTLRGQPLQRPGGVRAPAEPAGRSDPGDGLPRVPHRAELL